VFARIFNRLALEKRNPGKVVPIFMRTNDDYKIFGAFTLNTGGSVSFFPDFYQLDNFDHLTLNKDFIQKKGHLTKTESNGKRQKPINLEASLMGNGYYHLITFAMIDDDLLMDAPTEVELPAISYTTEEERLKYYDWIENSAHGQCTLEFPGESGFYCVQILVSPKGKSVEGLAVGGSMVEKVLSESVSLKDQIFISRKIEIPTSQESDFSILILTFKVPYEPKEPFVFLMAQDPGKPLRKGVLAQ
jgi:hypothetical protein